MKHDRETGHDEQARDPELEAAFDLLVHAAKAPPDFHATLMARVAHQHVRRGVFAWVHAPALPTPALVLTGLLLVSLAGNGWLGWHYSRPSDQYSAMRGPAAEETFDTLVHEADRYASEPNTTRALETYRKALNLMAFPLNQVAWLLYQEGQGSPQAQAKAAEGLPLARLAVQLRPDEAEYLDTLAVLLCAVGEHAEALGWMEKAAALQAKPFREKLERFRRGACQ